MSDSMYVPPRVRWNTGFGWSFWLVTGVIVTVMSITGLAHLGEPLGLIALPGAIACVLLFVGIRKLQGRKVVFDFTTGTVHTRGRAIPFAAITGISIRREGRAGSWMHLATGRKFVSRLALAETFYAAPKLEQWLAFREFVAIRLQLQAAGQPAGEIPAKPLLRPETPVAALEMMGVLNEQVAWVAAGKRSGSEQAPIRKLETRHIAF